MDEQTLRRTRVQLKEDHVAHVSSTDFPNQYPNIDNSELRFDLEKFQQKCKVKVTAYSKEVMEFDLIGVDASIANAIRRILIAEIPTVAIESVWIEENTSIIQDEILSHRLGLIPINVDPYSFDYKSENYTDLNTVIFDLDVKCEVRKGEHENKVVHSEVYSKDLTFVDTNDQAASFDQPIGPCQDDILIAKLIPGQHIKVRAFCAKGIGKDHAKFSPVGTASYRLLPDVIIKKDIVGELAHRFVSKFPAGAAEVYKKKGKEYARMVDNRKVTMSREVLRDPELADKVLLTRVRDHFLFNIESTGAMQPEVLLTRSIELLRQKCVTMKQALERLRDSSGEMEQA